MSAVTSTTKPSLRIILSSRRALDVLVAAVAGVALALAFPKTNAAWLAPVGAAALFWTWRSASWKRAFVLGWFAGTVFFALTSSWVTHTVGSDLGPYGPALVIGPSMMEGFFFGLAGAATAVAARRTPAWALPLACAAAFTAFEWLRSIGFFGAPFMQLGYTQAETPLGIFAAYIGTYGVTFVIVAIGAYLADALARRAVREAIVALGTIAVALLLCWLAWPARTAASIPLAPTMRVSAIQGNIQQSLKWTPGAVVAGIQRYTAMTHQAAPFRPHLIVWPETVVAEVLNSDPQTMAQFGHLARDVNATLVVGAQEIRDRRMYNSLFMFTPDGALEGIYDKRQLVPIAEIFPDKEQLGWIPYVTALGGAFSSGTADTVYGTTPLRFAPLICWESAFADLAFAQVKNGAQVFVIATDDAWFGETAGPYMHAQIAQLRAIEYGMWVVRAGATGVSGIIAPDGRWVQKTQLDTLAIVNGIVGAPVGSVFSHFGPTPVGIAMILLYIALVVRRRTESA